MSERGSFVTEYIYCKTCLEAIKPILLASEKYLNSLVIKNLPIIAGKIGGLYAGEEIHTFESEFKEKIEKVICHPLRIAVLAEQGESMILCTPGGSETGTIPCDKCEELKHDIAQLSLMIDRDSEIIKNLKYLHRRGMCLVHNRRDRKDAPCICGRRTN